MPEPDSLRKLTRRAKRAGLEDEVALKYKPEAEVEVPALRDSSFLRPDFSAAALAFKDSSLSGPRFGPWPPGERSAPGTYWGFGPAVKAISLRNHHVMT